MKDDMSPRIIGAGPNMAWLVKSARPDRDRNRGQAGRCNMGSSALRECIFKRPKLIDKESS